MKTSLKEKLFNVSNLLGAYANMRCFGAGDILGLVTYGENGTEIIRIELNNVVGVIEISSKCKMAEGWHEPFVNAVRMELPDFKIVLREYTLVNEVEFKDCEVEIVTQSEYEPYDPSLPDEEPVVDNDDDFDPVVYSNTKTDFFDLKEKFYDDDVMPKSPEIIIEEQKANGERDTDDELLNPDPDQDILNKLQEELEGEEEIEEVVTGFKDISEQLVETDEVKIETEEEFEFDDEHKFSEPDNFDIDEDDEDFEF